MMKCEIIRDLLPSYMDGLTSVESNEMIEKHLEQCEECNTYFEEIRKEIFVVKIENDKEIQPFIKIKEKTARIVLVAVILTACISALAIDSWRSYWRGGKSMKSHEVTVTFEEKNGIQMFTYEPKDDKIVVDMGITENKLVDGKKPLKTFSFVARKKHPEFNAINQGSYMFYFVDEDTMIDLQWDPYIREVSEDDFFAVEFDDVVKTIKISDLREGNIESLK